MVAFMMLVFAAVAVYLFSNVKRLRRENSDMQQRVFNLEALVNKLQVQFRSGEAALPPEELQSEALMIADQIAETVVHTPPDMVSVPEAAGKESPNQSAPGKRNIWQILETQFVENWTGILGSIILVMGIGFLGIFAALKFSPLMRFSMMCGAAGMLYGIYRYFNFRQKWLKLASWLRSAAGAIFLFACLGAGGIPGLQWIFDPLSGLVVLAAWFQADADPTAAWWAVRRDANHHRSPNAGWPEAAFAGALGLRLAGPRRYGESMVEDAWMGDGRAEATAEDIRRALSLFGGSCTVLAGIATLLIVIA